MLVILRQRPNLPFVGGEASRCQGTDHSEGYEGPCKASLHMSQPTYQARCKSLHPWRVPYSLLPSWEGVHAKPICNRAGALRAQWQSDCKCGLGQPMQ